MFGVFKIGVVYFFFDLEFLVDCIFYMLEDVKFLCIIMIEEIVVSLFDDLVVFEFVFDQVVIQEIIKCYLLENQDVLVLFDYFVYIIYILGLIGRLKGVVVIQKSLSNFLLFMQEVFFLGEEDRLLVVMIVVFDILVLELYFLLISGV